MLMTTYNVVLGKPWLTEHNPRIVLSTITLFFKGVESYQCQDETTNDGQPAVLVNEAPFMNIRHSKKELRRGAECIIVKVEAAANQEESLGSWTALSISDDLDQSKKEQTGEILGKHTRCFSSLFPHRKVTHEIKVEEGARPPSRPPFRMSLFELDELQRQL